MTAMLKGRLHLSVLPQTWHSVRPRDCAEGDEPCPWRECPYAIDNPKAPEVTCAIDVADEGPLPQTEVARILGISQPRVVFLEQSALARAKKFGGYTGEDT